MTSVDDYNEVKDCIYKNEHFSVRDNGAIMRHPRESMRIRKDDKVWTFGKPNDKTGYMDFAGQRVHRIVAYAFHGNPPTDQYVVDHIDTNRRNNRPENLRWVTRLENTLNNEITRAKIELICGSIEAFLENPSLLHGHEKEDKNFAWMRNVSSEEASISLERLTKWAKEKPKPKGGMLGEWIYQKQNLSTTSYHTPLPSQREEPLDSELIGNSKRIQSLTSNAVQINWRIPSVFPCCPQESKSNSLEAYQLNLKVGSVFCKNNTYTSVVIDSAISEEDNSLYVMTQSIEESPKPWALAKIVFADGIYIHESMGAFFSEKGAMKYFTLAQGKEWAGGDVIEDFY